MNVITATGKRECALRLPWFPDGMFKVTGGHNLADVINGISCVLEQVEDASFALATTSEKDVQLSESDITIVAYSINFLATIARGAVNSLTPVGKEGA